MRYSQEDVERLLKKENFLNSSYFRYCSSSTVRDITLLNYKYTDNNHFKTIEALKDGENNNIPLCLIPRYYAACQKKRNYIYEVETITPPKLYKTFNLYLESFLKLKYSRIYKITIENTKYYISYGVIFNARLRPLIYVEANVKVNENSELIPKDAIVYIDKTVFSNNSIVYKTIRNLLMPAFLVNNYDVVITDVKNKRDIFEHPNMPNHLRNAIDEVYSTLQSNFNVIKSYIN